MHSIHTKKQVSYACIPWICIILLFMCGFAHGQLNANFTASKTIILVGEGVWFTDLSTNAFSWDWEFEGGFPSGAHIQGPHYVQYFNAGVFDVKLTVMGAAGGTDSTRKQNFITVLEKVLDFGDAPSSTYPTLELDNGARHYITDSIYLGAGVDDEPDGQANATATGDDNNGDDEDGVIIPTLIAGQVIFETVVAHGAGNLFSWIDFNADGDWDDPGEAMFAPLTDGTHSLPVPVPLDAVTGKSIARFRYTTMPSLGYTGFARDGEVEDYEVTIEAWDYGDAPDPTFSTLQTSNGPRHLLHPTDYICLGSSVDSDPDGQPDAKASGDDTDGMNDDDGVTFVNYNMGYPVIEEGTEPVTINVSGPGGQLNAWIDFNRDGDWNDPGEQVFQDHFLPGGISSENIIVPPITDPGFLFARFRISRSQGLGPEGPALDGEVEDYALIAVVRDYGDAPDPSYPTLKINNGASHIIKGPTFCMGSSIDSEPDGQPDAGATGDDLDGNNDDDGVVFGSPLVVGQPVNLVVTVNHPWHLNAWIDYDGDGTFLWSERIFLNEIVIPGANNLSFTVPNSITPKTTFARFRICTKFGMDPYGPAPDGEVEDYQVTIYPELDSLDFGDAPDIYPTTMANCGAAHALRSYIFLGNLIDLEPDGQPDADAMGDDQADLDDEDGVVFITPLIPGNQAKIQVTCTKGNLNGWLDFDGNGDWIGPGEHIICDLFLGAGTHIITFNVPMGAVQGTTFARFRLNIQSGIGPTGFVPAGEVEDYKVTIGELTEGALKWSQPPLKNPDSDYPDSFRGWDEISIFDRQIIADDWFCHDDRPVTDIHWWGSYDKWANTSPPANAPKSFHICVWTNTEDADSGHPGVVVHEWRVNRDELDEHVAGSDFVPEMMSGPDSCFRYDFIIPQSDWFYQEGDSTVYWLSIAAEYQSIPDQYRWGWKTRDRYFKEDALRITTPADPVIGSEFKTGEIISEGWDMSFLLTTTEYSNDFDFGDAPDPDYPTVFASNGAHHIIWPGVTLGSEIDAENDGLHHASANGDDSNGTADEDGVEFLTSLLPGQTALIQVTASVDGFLNAWMDFNGNGSWEDPDDQIFTDQPVTQGENLLTFSVPKQAGQGNSFARFRFSQTTGVTSKGLVVGGEVEDYAVPIMTAVEKSENMQKPDKFRLYQNYPNPFNPMTTICYELPKTGHTVVQVFDILGREMAVLVDQKQDAGHYSFQWNGSEYSSGIYLLHIQAGEYHQSIKMVILK
ncbi:T9SS type A sorting domain-containing protein [bacterium]|nr:T9SS type A sorting domain-containing protein [bacterium]